MEAQEFVAEVYRRMTLIHGTDELPMLSLHQFWQQNAWLKEYYRINFSDLLPSDRSGSILDVGGGDGQFAAAALLEGYADVSVADFGAHHFPRIQSWGASQTLKVDRDLPTLLAGLAGRYDLIHASHLIEHIPKHDLLENVDAMFYALKPGGRIVLVTPNMLAPTAMWSLFVTLGHEYGFSPDNLRSLMSICGFSPVRVRDVRVPSSRVRWKATEAVRTAIGVATRLRNRAYGANTPCLAGSILVVATRPQVDPLSGRRAGNVGRGDSD